MLIAKPAKSRDIETKINRDILVEFQTNNGKVDLKTTKKIVAIELDVYGKFELTYTLPNHWIARNSKRKIVLVDPTLEGIVDQQLFTFTGHMKIEKPLAITDDQEIVIKYITDDEKLYKWNLSKGNAFDTNTTTWDNMQSQNKPVKSLDTGSDDNENQTAESAIGSGPLGIG
tara:strand:+ start:2030 stop:2545 length:516 start_codon:yes stop_codon:yes gene_type:complete